MVVKMVKETDLSSLAEEGGGHEKRALSEKGSEGSVKDHGSTLGLGDEEEHLDENETEEMSEELRELKQELSRIKVSSPTMPYVLSNKTLTSNVNNRQGMLLVLAVQTG
jgi:ribosomal protein L29